LVNKPRAQLCQTALTIPQVRSFPLAGRTLQTIPYLDLSVLYFPSRFLFQPNVTSLSSLLYWMTGVGPGSLLLLSLDPVTSCPWPFPVMQSTLPSICGVRQGYSCNPGLEYIQYYDRSFYTDWLGSPPSWRLPPEHEGLSSPQTFS
jgi:hypothetical protein